MYYRLTSVLHLNIALIYIGEQSREVLVICQNCLEAVIYKLCSFFVGDSLIDLQRFFIKNICCDNNLMHLNHSVRSVIIKISIIID
jgi:hypothetical protein